MYDLIVVGGGLTGVGAAVAAARNGLKVLILEKSGFLGGAACNSYVNPFMTFHITLDGKERRICDGFFGEIVDELHRMNGFHPITQAFNEEYLKLILDKFVKEEENIDVLFHALVSKVEVTDDKIKSVTVPSKSKEHAFEAKYFIDCTGDANLAAMADCPFELGRPEDNLCQPMTLCFRLGNIDTDLFVKEFPSMQKMYKEYRAMGKIKNPRNDIMKFGHVSEGVVHFNTTRIIKRNPIDIFDVSRAETEAREQMYELYTFLKENFESCKNATLLASAPEIGIRESRRIVGEYMLTAQDEKSLARFDDSISACNYEVDIHDPAGGGTSTYVFKEGEYYTIPYRCLVPKKINNLLVAGRCISATHEAIASLRIMPVCCTLGQAAGTAVAVAKKNNTTEMKNVDTNEVRSLLSKAGAFIG